ncbi:Uncharacterized protein TPAR_07413 [Tolypocladium paradoxum]|uniref:Linalool dehydratase/isomerase domain-containing protein n=1 Tax=Tolypocladium paradoxum TaxID=94208 RepID=A0A2S4KQA9_9HYPO|nr:Uncharacterized protein TPAR_07413 [Tolypocladium paradoxum]
MKEPKDQPSARPPPDISRYPKLDAAQAGHLRHFHNLSSQLDGQWHHMAGFEPLQELFDSYRYQISVIAYAVGVAHFHRLPASRSMFKKLLDQIIHKMLLRDVWGYWYNASVSGSYVDPGRAELRKPWADPIIKENIMYSGHILMMTSMYAMLFDDDKFEKPGSLTFHWDPLLWGLGTESFVYDNRSIQAAIIAEMERSKWIGVCCEPNLVFIVCNQFPIIAMRYNDVRDGTNVAGEVVEKYKSAWDKRGMVAPNGLYIDWLYFNQDEAVPPSDICFTAWANAYMNTWNSELIKSLYDKQALGYITNVDGQVRLHDHHFAVEYRKMVEAGGIDRAEGSHRDTAERVAEARAQREINRPPPDKYTDPVLGCVVQWLSELGKTTELQGLLDYADAHLNPKWEDGGLFYPRKDPSEDEPDEWSHMDPFTGNAGIPYARLNVPEGQKKMWDDPWTRESLAARPWIDGIDLSQGVDTLRGIWDGEERVLVLTLRTWHGGPVTVEPVARNLDAGAWAVHVNGALVKQDSVEDRGSLSATVTVGGEDVDVIFQHVGV